MCRGIYLIVFLAFICGCDAHKWKIIEGLPVKSIEDYPFIVSLQYGDHHVCGGSIINKRYVLTAAHCIRPWGGDPKLLEYTTIRVGSLSSLSGGKIYKVEYFVVHPSWKKSQTLPYYADVALMKLKEDIEFSETIQPAKLPEENDELPEESTLTVLGWGYSEYGEGTTPSAEEFLLYTKMQVYNMDVCIRQYRDYLDITYEDPAFRTVVLPHDKMICLVGQGDFCTGDSGGPVVDENNVQVGIISFNLDCGTDAPLPSAVTDVRKWLKWIKDASEIKEQDESSIVY